MSQMAATTATTRLDAHALRADFPFLEELVNGLPMAYLDSAVSTQKPRQVLDAMRDFYEHSYTNVHRSVYRLAGRAPEGYEGARRKGAAFVKAPAGREGSFTPRAPHGPKPGAHPPGFRPPQPGDI